jgi:hypothetical protein
MSNIDDNNNNNNNVSRFSIISEYEDDKKNVFNYDKGWEKNISKHIFILSSSGKPIYSRIGDEQEMVTTFGLIRAIAAVVQDSGDELKCIKAGKRRIVYFIRNYLYFVSISSTGEPEAILCKQLEFLYSQILLVLTSQVHNVLKNNSSKDLRDLLGSDSKRLMDAACQYEITPIGIAFESVEIYSINKDLRDYIIIYLKSCVNNSGAALGILIHGDTLLVYLMNDNHDFVLNVSDVLLLTHFVGNSNSLRSHDQNWVPICLPTFNSTAYLQAYISNLHLTGKFKPMDLSLVLISTSSDAKAFKDLHLNRIELEKTLINQSIADRIFTATERQMIALKKIMSTAMCLHFLYKIRPSGGLPSQYIISPFEFPVDNEESRNSIITHYQRLSLYLRKGSSLAEYTINISPNIVVTPPSSDHSLAYVIMSTGQVIVSLATVDSELYATFSGTMTALESSRMADFLSKSLKSDVAEIFQTV